MENYALKSKKRYPLNTEEQVKTAADYFNAYHLQMPFSDRAEMAHNIVKQADAMQVKAASATIKNYSNHKSYSPEFEQNILLRKTACRTNETTIDILDKPIPAAKVLEKIASNKKDCPPIRMVQIIAEFDKRAGIDAGYDNYIKDPYFTVFGCATNPEYDLEKLAAGVTEKDVTNFANKLGAKDVIMTYFGENAAQEYIADPVGFYKNLPIEEREAVNNIVRDSKNE